MVGRIGAECPTGKGIPYGIYDALMGCGSSFINTSHDASSLRPIRCHHGGDTWAHAVSRSQTVADSVG